MSGRACFQISAISSSSSSSLYFSVGVFSPHGLIGDPITKVLR